ncbi:MAG: hypothetical protein OXG37_01425 [Actinomycetia bacterium]|nr:hypothetical protein [Actinomycetes bacterium]
MRFGARKTLVLGAVALTVVMAAAGSALALGKAEDHEAMLSDIAGSLGVEQEALEDAVREAQINRIDAAEAGGLLDAEKAARLRERVESAETPLLGSPWRGHRGHGFGKGLQGESVEAAAGALGVTVEELRELLPGSSLAAVAEERGVSVETVMAAIVAAGQEQIDQALADGRIDAGLGAEKSERLTERATRLVGKTFPEEGQRWRGKRGQGFHERGLLPATPAGTPA